MAFTFEIVTHGGFDLVRDVWVFVASIFGSGLYRGLLTAVFLLSLTLAAAGGFLEGLLGGRLTSVGSWVRGFFIAIFFYYTFMTGNASVQIYDDVSGQTHLQSGIPVGIAMIAGLANKVAIGLEDMFSSFITTPVALSDIGYERGIKMLQESYDGVMKTALATQVAPQAWDSANHYVSDCVAIEAVRSSAYRAQIDQNTDVLNAWALAAHPVLYTYTGLDASGNPLTGTVPKENVTCAEAWNRLNAYFSSTDWDNVVNKFCNMMSFDASDPLSLAACKTVYENTVKEFVLGGTFKAAKDVAKNLFAGKVWNNFLSYLDNSIEAARAAAYARVSSELSGIGIMAQEWIPVIKVMIFVLIVGMLPLVMLFMVTPYAIDAFKFIAGIFCWWVIWCGLDHMMMLWWVNKLYPIFAAVSDGGKLGATGVTQLWTLASKSLALLGNLRSFGMLIASAMMFSIVKFGGSAIAHLTMALGAGAIRGVGAQTAASYITPEERAWEQTMERVAAYNRELMAARMAAEHYGGIDGYYQAKAKADVAGEVAEIESYRQLESSLGPGSYSVGRALGEGQAGAAYKNVAQGRAALMQSLQGLTQMYQAHLTKAQAQAAEYQNVLDKVKTEKGFSTDLEAAKYLARPEVAKQYGVAEGLYQEYGALRAAGVLPAGTSMEDYMAQREAIRGMLGGADVFAFARQAGEMGLSPAQAAYAKALFSWSKEMGHMNELMQRFKGKDLSELTPQEIGELGNTLGRVYGAFEHAKATAGGLGMNEAIFTRYQEGMNEATKFFANAAAATWLETGELPDWIAEPLNEIASTPEGKRMLQKHLSNLEISSLTPEQARRLNQALAAKGLATRFKPGDAARLYLGYTGDPKHPFTVSLAKADAGAERKQADTTDIRQGIHYENWNGFFKLGKDGYTVQGAKSFEYDPRTGRFSVKGALVRDVAGNAYQADIVGKGRVIKDSAGNIVGIEVKNLKDLAVEKFESVHGVRMPEFNLTPEKAFNLAHNPEKLAATLEKFKDNPLVRQAFVTEFANKLAQGLQAYGDISYKEGVGKEQREIISASAGASVSGRTGPTVETVGKIMPAPLARLMKSLGFGGSAGLNWQKQLNDTKSEKADASFRIAAAAIRRTLDDGYALADKEGIDNPIETAAYRVFSAVSSYEEQAKKAVDQHIKLEKEAGKTDLTGTTPTEYMTGEKVKVERLGETIDVRGIDGKKQIPYKAVSAEELNEKN